MYKKKIVVICIACIIIVSLVGTIIISVAKRNKSKDDNKIVIDIDKYVTYDIQ